MFDAISRFPAFRDQVSLSSSRTLRINSKQLHQVPAQDRFLVGVATDSPLHIATLIHASKFFPTYGNQSIRIDPILFAIQVSKHVYFLKPRSMQNIFHFLTGI